MEVSYALPNKKPDLCCWSIKNGLTNQQEGDLSNQWLIPTSFSFDVNTSDYTRGV